jgi:hypothetical protein
MAPRVALSVDFGQGISNAWSSVANIVPKLLAFAVIMLVGWLVAKAVARVLDSVLRKVGVERLAEKAGMGRMLRDSAWDTTTILCKIVYYGLLLVTLQLGFGVFGPNPISDLIHSVVAWIPRGLVAVVIFVVTMAIANVVREMVTNMLSATSYGKTVGAVPGGHRVVRARPDPERGPVHDGGHRDRRPRRRPHPADEGTLGEDAEQGRGGDDAGPRVDAGGRRVPEGPLGRADRTARRDDGAGHTVRPGERDDVLTLG